jgi:isocitrate dehydrogenase kinase/phosphatase
MLADIEAAVAPHAASRYPKFVEVPMDARAFFEPAAWQRLRDVKAR